MNDRTPAQLYALLVGGTLLAAGIIGFFYSSDFGSPGEVDSVFGILDVNGWHNVVHIVTGALGLATLGYAARAYAGALGVVYLVVAIWASPSATTRASSGSSPSTPRTTCCTCCSGSRASAHTRRRPPPRRARRRRPAPPRR
jgi:hypothetical protein